MIKELSHTNKDLGINPDNYINRRSLGKTLFLAKKAYFWLNVRSLQETIQKLYYFIYRTGHK